MKKIGTTMDPAKMGCRRSREAIHGIDVGHIKGFDLLAQRTPQGQGELVLARLDPAREVADLDAFFEDRLAEGNVQQPVSIHVGGVDGDFVPPSHQFPAQRRTRHRRGSLPPRPTLEEALDTHSPPTLFFPCLRSAAYYHPRSDTPR